MIAYEAAMRANPQSVPAMSAISAILRSREEHRKAAEFLQAILKIDPTHGEAYGYLGHCCLMFDDLQGAYQAYQEAIRHLGNPKVRRGKQNCIFIY